MALLKTENEISDSDFIYPSNEIEEFIINNWRVMNDEQIAKELGVFPHIVKTICSNLGLKRGENFHNRKLFFDRSKINKEEIIKALNEDGFIVDEFIKYKNWKITRQGLYFVLNEMGIRHLVSPIRSNEWHKNRYLRIYPQLIDKKWLKSKENIKEILKELRISASFFLKIRKILNIKIKKTQKGEKTIWLNCKYCGKRFKKRLASYKQMKDAGQENFYCLRSHYFADKKEKKNYSK